MGIKNNVEKGRIGEEIAKQYLSKIGYKIIDTNWHYSKNAEIDIIAEDNGILVFVEVKTRTNLNFGHPFEAINYSKMQKIRTAIYGYLNKSAIKYKGFRLDGIAVIGFKNTEIQHIKNLGQY